MRFEIVIIIIAGCIIANIYTQGKYLKLLMTGKKYYQMAGIAFGAIMLCLLVRYNPMRAGQLLHTSNEYIKYLPIDKNASSIISPILDFTTKQNFGDLDMPSTHPLISMPSIAESRLRQSGTKSTKRSVSETKKKFVASNQNWRCGDCGEQLSAWFEVDHKIRLEHGGSNHIDNLVALCRECHGKKTAMENMSNL